MAKMPGIPFDQGSESQGSLNPTAVILHRTYGSWNGDYSVGVGTGREGIGFHFLVGKAEGNWVQFYDTRVKCSHAKGANSWSVGIEFEGTNEQALTPWQVDAGGRIVRWLSGDIGIPLSAYYDGPRKGQSSEYRGHRTVADSDHSDYITRADYDKMVAGAPPLEEPDTMQLIGDFNGQIHYFYVADGGTLWHAWWGHVAPFGRNAEQLGDLSDYDGQPSALVHAGKLHVVCDRAGANAPVHWFNDGRQWGQD